MTVPSLLRFFPPPAFLALSSVGLDISDRTVKFAELAPARRGPILHRFAERSIPEGIVERGEVKDARRLSRELAALRNDFNLGFVRLSLPEEKAFIFRTDVPAGAERGEARSVIEFKLEENVPLAPAEAVFDYELSPPREDKHCDATVSVYPRQTVDEYLAALSAAGLVPLSLEIEAHAIARAVVPAGDAGTYLIADIGRRRTGVAIVSRGIVGFSATLDVGGESLTRAIEKHYGVSEAEAERIKNERGFLKGRDEKELSASLMATVSVLRDELNRHFMFWHTQKDPAGKPVPPIAKLLLCGGNANLAGLPEYLASSLRIRVEKANVWANTSPFEDAIPPLDAAHSLSYATAVGLALRNFL